MALLASVRGKPGRGLIHGRDLNRPRQHVRATWDTSPWPAARRAGTRPAALAALIAPIEPAPHSCGTCGSPSGSPRHRRHHAAKSLSSSLPPLLREQTAAAAVCPPTLVPQATLPRAGRRANATVAFPPHLPALVPDLPGVTLPDRVTARSCMRSPSCVADDAGRISDYSRDSGVTVGPRHRHDRSPPLRSSRSAP